MLKKLQQKISNPLHRRLVIIVGLVLSILLTLTTIRIWAAIKLRLNTNEQSIPVVNIISARQGQLFHNIQLPGALSPWHDASIYARTSGYIKDWYVDIGDHVAKGQVLADIDAPELEAQLQQAKAQLNVAIANNKIAQFTAERWKNLVKSDWVSKQTTDEKVDTAKAVEASVIAATAEYHRLEELVGFKQVTAPFSGTITARNTDIGALINAGSNPKAQPLFRLEQNDPLRLYVKIPQNYSSKMTPNMRIQFASTEHPEQLFKATLLNTAKAIDPKTGTLLAEFVVDNKKGKLLPGSYTEVHFKLPVQTNTIRLPVNAIIFRAQGLQVATLNQKNQVVLKQVTIHRDFGNEVEINSGVTPGDRVIINPSDSIVNGEFVRVALKR